MIWCISLVSLFQRRDRNLFWRYKEEACLIDVSDVKNKHRVLKRFRVNPYYRCCGRREDIIIKLYSFTFEMLTYNVYVHNNILHQCRTCYGLNSELGLRIQLEIHWMWIYWAFWWVIIYIIVFHSSLEKRMNVRLN